MISSATKLTKGVFMRCPTLKQNKNAEAIKIIHKERLVLREKELAKALPNSTTIAPITKIADGM